MGCFPGSLKVIPVNLQQTQSDPNFPTFWHLSSDSELFPSNKDSSCSVSNVSDLQLCRRSSVSAHKQLQPQQTVLQHNRAVPIQMKTAGSFLKGDGWVWAAILFLRGGAGGRALVLRCGPGLEEPDPGYKQLKQSASFVGEGEYDGPSDQEVLLKTWKHQRKQENLTDQKNLCFLHESQINRERDKHEHFYSNHSFW